MDFSICFLPSKLKPSRWRDSHSLNVEFGVRSAEQKINNRRRCLFRVPNSALRVQDVGRHGFAPCSRRLRAGTSLSKFATRKRRDAKAELNRRNQACEVLADTGIRVAKSYR
jgi:hypothetical protein